MAIKNKDGTEYFFTRPNPLLSSQSLWPKNEKIILEGNFRERVSVGPPQTIEEVTKPVNIPIKEESPEEEIKIIQTIIKKQDEELVKKTYGVIDMWVLPAYIEESTDTLYNETYSRKKYGNKIQIQAKVYDNTSDLAIQVITKQVLEQDSIIFPQNRDRRWWKVVRTDEMEQKGFYLVTAEVSDYQPSFSD